MSTSMYQIESKKSKEKKKIGLSRADTDNAKRN